VAAAVVASALAWSAYVSGRKGGSWKGITLGAVSGVLLGSIHPLLDLARAGEIGLGPYAIAFMFSLGLFFSTFIFNLYFINLPVEGAPVGLVDYFRGTFRQHALGAAGGILWCVGLLANFVSSSAPPEVRVAPALSRAIGESATLLSALWGLLVWKEYAGASTRVRLLLALMFTLFAAGLAVVSIAPLYPD
jgi:glucose uptake protein